MQICQNLKLSANPMTKGKKSKILFIPPRAEMVLGRVILYLLESGVIMCKISLSKRLKMVADCVRPGDILADIGTDHAYLPIYLIQKGCIPRAIAGEIAEGPFLNAQKAIQSAHLADKIDLYQGSGLAILSESACVPGTISICGMGGLLITSILEDGKKKGYLSIRPRLVLQANNFVYDVRKWLLTHQYSIVREEMVSDSGKFYEIIVAEHAGILQEYSELELNFGPCLMREQSALFKEKWTQRLAHLEVILSQIQEAGQSSYDKEKEIESEINQIKEVIG